MARESTSDNIVHTVSLRTVVRDLGPLNLRGLIVIHPYFESKERIESKKVDSEVNATVLELQELFWRLSLPPGSDRDYPNCNP